MSLEENNGTPFTMPVMPAYGGGYGNNGGLFGNGDLSWLILLLLCGWGGGFGMGGFGMGGMMWPMMMGMGGGFGLDYLYPWLNNSQHISDGFRDQTLQTSIGALQNSVTSGFGDVQNALCSGFAGVNAGISNAAAQAEISANARQMANMQQAFASQTATAQGFNAVQGQLAQCCCDNRAGLADVKYTIATENCADRAALSDGIRDLLAATQAQTQTILTQLCNDKLEAKNDLIAQLRQQLNMADLRASQVAQTADIRANNATVANQLVSELRSCPIPAQPVYGNTPIFSCSGNSNGFGCGCGCNG